MSLTETTKLPTLLSHDPNSHGASASDRGTAVGIRAYVLRGSVAAAPKVSAMPRHRKGKSKHGEHAAADNAARIVLREVAGSAVRARLVN